MPSVQSVSKIYLVSAQTEAGQQKSIRHYLAPGQVRRIIKVLYYYYYDDRYYPPYNYFPICLFPPRNTLAGCPQKANIHTTCKAGKWLI